jgi:hypothetical protein
MENPVLRELKRFGMESGTYKNVMPHSGKRCCLIKSAAEMRKKEIEDKSDSKESEKN